MQYLCGALFILIRTAIWLRMAKGGGIIIIIISAPPVLPTRPQTADTFQSIIVSRPVCAGKLFPVLNALKKIYKTQRCEDSEQLIVVLNKVHIA